VLALRTLLELGPLGELDEGFIILVETAVDAVLLARHPHVVVAAAPQAVVLLAGRAAVVVQCLVELEDSLASCSRAPRSAGVILLDELIEGEFLEFLSQLPVNVAENLTGV
jgi:hypothetical protein